MPPMLHIHLLGDFRIYLDDQPLDLIKRPRQQALLAYLLLHRHAPQARQHLAFTFWPDSTEEQAFTNLRKLFFQLRQSLPAPDTYLYSTSQHIGWRNDAPFRLDVAELEQALEQLEKKTSIDDLAVVEQVLALYSGELMPDCYDEWLLVLRNNLHERVLNSLTNALATLEHKHEIKLALRVAEYLLRLDPLRESTYRHLMRLRALSGDRPGALRVFHECVRALELELGVPPASETRALYEQLLKTEPKKMTPAYTPAQRHEHIPLVGRKHEWQMLQLAWSQMNTRGSHMVTVWGEAGIGKSRLVEELTHWASLHPGSVLYARAYAAEGSLAYAPVTTWLRNDLLQPGLAKLETVWLSELVRLLPELQRQFPELPAPAPLSEGWQLQRFHEAIARALLTAPAPRVLVLEDMQWCDSETFGLLRYLLRFDRAAKLLIVGTARREAVDEQHPVYALRQQLLREAQWTELELHPLNFEETIELASHLTHEDFVAWKARIYQETEGNPLFVVEMVQAGMIQAKPEVQNGQAVRLPTTVQTVIEARLAQLSSHARQLAQFAATMGRAFTVDVLAKASDLDEDDLIQALDELWRRRIIREHGPAYDFTHDKIREVAYAQQSQMRRRLAHRRIGEALTQVYAGRLELVAGELAVHAEQAGQLEEAIHYLRLVAEQAQTVGAYAETITRFRHAIELLALLPLPQEAAMQQELAMLVPLGTCLIALRGYAHPDVAAVYQRAHQLCTQLGDDPHLMPVLVGLVLFYVVRGELHQAHKIGEQSLQLAQRMQDADLLVEGHTAMGLLLQYLGQFRASVTHLEQALALYDPDRHGAHAAIYGQDPGVACRMCLGISLWFLGYADRSLHLMQEALAMAYQVNHPYTLMLAQNFTSYLHSLRREPTVLQTAAATAVEFASRQGFFYWLMINTIYHGWARVHVSVAAGEPVSQALETVAQMREALAGFMLTGATLYRGYYMSLIADACASAGDMDAAVTTLDEALAIMEAADERDCLAELQRLRGEFWLKHASADLTAQEREANAEKAFLQAMHTAHAQEARMLELRAATNLARLWMQQGKSERAYHTLKPLADWFTEGLDTVDLQNAKALLASLA
jgi:DNA-binding SARP family transcriptional activator/tetratricopeptide (TPR) repeat protein